MATPTTDTITVSPITVPTPTTAAPVITSPAVAPQQGEDETASRLSVPSQGIVSGVTRDADDDLTILVTRQAIQIEVVKQIRVVKTVTLQNDPVVAASTSQSITQTINRTNTSQKRTVDVARALRKLQRTCNHSFDRVSKRCLFCTKHRDSHVYDTLAKSILN